MLPLKPFAELHPLQLTVHYCPVATGAAAIRRNCIQCSIGNVSCAQLEVLIVFHGICFDQDGTACDANNWKTPLSYHRTGLPLHRIIMLIPFFQPKLLLMITYVGTK